MAKLYSPLGGVMRGRVGSTVLRKGQRAVVASQYQPQVSNPRSYAQAVQRCAFATATAAQKALYDIVDHSFEGLSTRRENLQEFVRVNSKKIAALIKANASSTAFVLNLKGVSGLQLAPIQISRGSLAAPSGWEVSATIGVTKAISYGNAALTAESYAAALRELFGCAPGEQFSVVAVLAHVGVTSGAYTPSSGGVVRNVFTEVAKFRATFVEELPGDGLFLFNEDGTLNASLLSSSEGDFSIKAVAVDAGSGFAALQVEIARDLDDGSVVCVGAAAVVRSALSERGYLYSSSALQIADFAIEEIGGDTLAAFVESYQASTASFASDYFLDNAV